MGFSFGTIKSCRSTPPSDLYAAQDSVDWSHLCKTRTGDWPVLFGIRPKTRQARAQKGSRKSNRSDSDGAQQRASSSAPTSVAVAFLTENKIISRTETGSEPQLLQSEMFWIEQVCRVNMVVPNQLGSREPLLVWCSNRSCLFGAVIAGQRFPGFGFGSHHFRLSRRKQKTLTVSYFSQESSDMSGLVTKAKSLGSF